MAGRDDRSALIALRELRAIEEQRVVDERQARIDDEKRRREQEERRRREEVEAARAEAERLLRDQAERERVGREAAAVDAARLRGELAAALERIQALSAEARPIEAPRGGRGWMVGCLLSTLAAFGLALVLAVRPPVERTVFVPKPVVIAGPPVAPPPAAQPVATTPPEVAPRVAAPRPPRPPREPRPAATAAHGLSKCEDGDILCHVDDGVDDVAPKRKP
jgi:hypothetical protein